MAIDQELRSQKPFPSHPLTPDEPEIFPPQRQVPEIFPTKSPEIHPQRGVPEIAPSQPDREVMPTPSPDIEPPDIPPEIAPG